jgi:quercetin dioxygenase-like cupin family protein
MSRARERLHAEGLQPSSWSNGPRDRYAAHQHPYDKVIVCGAGSIAFGLPDRDETIDLHPGDRLELPAGTLHDARVGAQGVCCLEAHLPAGTWTSPARRAAGEW